MPGEGVLFGISSLFPVIFPAVQTRDVLRIPPALPAGSCPNFYNPDKHKMNIAMVKFKCNCCGKCCSSFGEFIKVERQITDRDYFCRSGINNELFKVHVLPEFADEFAREFEEMEGNGNDARKKVCVFTRKSKPEGTGFLCAVYPTRPTICREFLCYRMLINHRPTGELRGRVIGVNELRTKDAVLEAIWKEKIAHLPHPLESEHHKIHHSPASGAEKSRGHDPHILAHINGLAGVEDREWVETVLTVLAVHGYHGDPVE
jgi:hypothetical protein